MDILTNLLVQIVSGAIGGNAVGTAKNVDLGPIGNTITGAIGGGIGGQILTALVPMLAAAGTNMDLGALTGDAASGGAAGAILTAIVGFIKNKTAENTTLEK